MTGFIFLVFSFAAIIYLPVSVAINLVDFQQQALDEHNYLRQLHCAPPLMLNSSISTTAQTYADYLAANNLFQHSGASGLGENLWAKSAGAAITFVNGSTPTNSWYSEISSYNYSAPGYSASTGHFTQVVWKSTTQMGIGIALSANGLRAVVVGNYYPPGNYMGQFPTNVLPLCFSPVGGD